MNTPAARLSSPLITEEHLSVAIEAFNVTGELLTTASGDRSERLQAQMLAALIAVGLPAASQQVPESESVRGALKAIEFAEYLAKRGEFLLDALNAEYVALQAVEEADSDAVEEYARLVADHDHRRECLSEAMTGLRGGIFEFRKRAAKVIVTPANAKATADASEQADALRDALEEVENTRKWYGSRFARLFRWAHDELTEEQKTRYFNIVANGSADVMEQAVYAEQLSIALHRAEQAETALVSASTGRIKLSMNDAVRLAKQAGLVSVKEADGGFAWSGRTGDVVGFAALVAREAVAGLLPDGIPPGVTHVAIRKDSPVAGSTGEKQ